MRLSVVYAFTISDKAASSVDEAVKALGKGMYVVKAIGTDGKTSAVKVMK